jgi:transposase-like protein
MTTRMAYSAEQKETATSLALEHGVKAAAAQTGINLNSLRSWVTRRQHGLPLDATPKKNERQRPHERPESPPLPEGVTLTDESGAIRTPRSLYISVARADGWWLEDRSNVTIDLLGRKQIKSWRHRPVASWVVIERQNGGLDDEPKWRDLVAYVPGLGGDNEALPDETVHESELDCLGPHGCTGHDLDIKKTPEVSA